MKQQIIPILIFQFAAFIGALGQLLYKRGAQGCEKKLSTYLYIFVGMIFYIGVTLLFILAYQLGGTVSVLYPTYAATFVWGLVLACLFAGEKLTNFKITGTLLVVGGICLVTL